MPSRAAPCWLALVRWARSPRRSFRIGALLLVSFLFCAPILAASYGVRHEPAQPQSGQPVHVIAEFKAGEVPAEATLEYQVVEPGGYLAKADRKFEKQWTGQPMTKAGDASFSAELPASLQKNRRLVRYRIRGGKEGAVVLPPSTDEQGNFAYFVYDGVPAWQGAIDPESSHSKSRTAMSFSPEVLTRVPVYHFLASRDAVENVMWRQPTNFGNDADRHAYKYTGTMVYDGIVYDHVKFRARGGAWRHAMGKNMWKFNFNPGHRFAARDHYGQSYAGKWDKLNLGACIQQGDYGMRGEQGMFEALTFRLFNLAGTAAPRTHWVHLRVVTDAEESPKDQYRGDFWGLYLATEEIDGDFLKEHDLPEGNIYKIDIPRPKIEHLADKAVKDQSDLRQFLGHVMQGAYRGGPPIAAGSDSWWTQNVELPRYYSYRAILECVHHYDLDSGKNYFFHHDLAANRWQVLPWDVDLSWGDHMFGGGNEPFYRAGVLRRAPFRETYQARLAEIRDLLFNPEQTGRLIDEHAAMIWDARGGPSLADADRAKWDHHPIMSSRYVLAQKSQPGMFYFGDSNNRFNVMIDTMKRYVKSRQQHLDRLLTGYNPPPSPRIDVRDPADFRGEKIGFRVASASGATGPANLQWRLAEVTIPGSPAFDPKQPWHYEIEALWETSTTNRTDAEVPADRLKPGHTYRVRARGQDAAGQWSRWSPPVEFVAKPR